MTKKPDLRFPWLQRFGQIFARGSKYQKTSLKTLEDN